MLKICITCPWANSYDIFNSYKRNTPGCSGVWKNVRGVHDINDADYLVVLDNLHESLLNEGKHFILSRFEYNRIIHFQRENTAIIQKSANQTNWYANEILPNLKHNISYEKGYMYTFAPATFINKTYDELKEMKYPFKNKPLSCVVSGKKLDHITDNYRKRIDFITKYSHLNQGDIDIYGKNWNYTRLGSNFKGELGSYHNQSAAHTDKSDGLIPYHFSICLENLCNERCISEKFTDALLCWCKPLYWGNQCVVEYFPSESFKLINIDDSNVYSYIKSIIQKPLSKSEINAISEAREIILDKMNIWEQIHQIISDYESYYSTYNINDSRSNSVHTRFTI